MPDHSINPVIRKLESADLSRICEAYFAASTPAHVETNESVSRSPPSKAQSLTQIQSGAVVQNAQLFCIRWHELETRQLQDEVSVRYKVLEEAGVSRNCCRCRDQKTSLAI